MKQSENTTSNAMQSFGDYVNKNYNPSLYPKYYLYKNCDSPLVHIDQIKIEYNKLYPDTATKEQAPEPSTPVLEGKEGFTGGDWWTSLDTQIDYENNRIDIHALKEDSFKPGLWVASVMFCQVPQQEAEANARLIAESKSMYYALKRFVEWYSMPFNEASIGNSIVADSEAIINRINNK